MARERFRDGAAVLATYEFPINHNDEDALDQNRSVERTAVTTGPAFVLQQGESWPGALRFKGTILVQAQLDAMQSYYDACSNRTVFFRDHEGTEQSVLITRFAVQRHRTARNPRSPALLHYWTYELEMEVLP